MEIQDFLCLWINFFARTTFYGINSNLLTCGNLKKTGKYDNSRITSNII